MIKNLDIKNFKSIKHLELDCKRVNVFIGKPNTGKSNILESIGIFSTPYGKIEDFVRFENMTNLFYDHNIEEKIEIRSDELNFELRFENGQFIGEGGDINRKFYFTLKYDYTKDLGGSSSGNSKIKFYKFEVLDEFRKSEGIFLLPPNGDNLLFILLTNKSFRKTVADIFSEFGLRIVLKPQESKIEVQKEVEDVIISYPFSLVSDTLQRVVFYLAAMETNKESIIVLEEPEAHAFPFYTKILSERIALDKSNQYFIATHNPYVLSSIVEKTNMNDMGIFITYYENYQTKVKQIEKDKLPLLLDLDTSIFFNLDKFMD